MREEERYLFDLNGYIVIRDVLTPEEVRALRSEVRTAGIEEALDTQKYLHVGIPREYQADPEWTGQDGFRYLPDSFILDWGPAIRSLVAHAKLAVYLTAMLGPDYRLDHSYGVFSRGRTSPHVLHNGATPFNPTEMYLYRDGKMHNSMVVVQFALTEVGPDDGGFCCLPGSHKANFRLPSGMPPLDALDNEWNTHVRRVAMRPGDVLIFTEAVTHGAMAWQGEEDRMALLFKYCQGALQWEKRSPLVSGEYSWNPTESRVLTGPYTGGRPPVLAEDEVVRDLACRDRPAASGRPVPAERMALPGGLFTTQLLIITQAL